MEALLCGAMLPRPAPDLCEKRGRRLLVSLFGEGSGRSFGDRMVLFAEPAADANGPDDFPAAFERHSAGKDHDLSVVGGMDAEELLAGLRVFSQSFGFDIEGARGEGLLLSDVDTADPGAFLALEGNEVGSGIDDGDVHGDADLVSFFLTSADNAACLFERDDQCFSRHRWISFAVGGERIEV